MRDRRLGTSAIEVLFASALLVLAFLPVMGLLQQSHKIATLDELQVLARHQATRAAALRASWSLQDWRRRAVGGAVDLELEDEEQPAQLRRRLRGMTIEVRLDDLEPGLVRIRYRVRWTDPASGSARRHDLVRFLEDPDLGRSRS